MSTDQLGPALRDLVDGVEDDALAPAPADLWRDGTRRRVRARAVPVLAAACVAGVVALLAWPAGAPRASVPAQRTDANGAVRLTAYPGAVPRPPFVGSTDRPGVSAAVVTEFGDSLRTYAVSPGGAVTRLDLSQLSPGDPGPSLSPDGRWLARGAVLDDLVTGQTLTSTSAREGLQATRMPADLPAWWAPDSRRAFTAAWNQGEPTSVGLVTAVDGSVTEVPVVDGGMVPVIAGWLDDDTLLALLGEGGEWSVRTWTLGASAWAVPGGVVAFEPGDLGVTRASLSPDGTRLLMYRAGQDDDGQLGQTDAMMFDPVTGEQIGLPLTDGVLRAENWAEGSSGGWDGWGCRPGWRDGLPVSTDAGVRFIPPRSAAPDLVDISSRFGDGACASFAGDELRGPPRTDAGQVWAERVWVWGGRALLVAPVLALCWWLVRRRGERAAFRRTFADRPDLPTP